MNYRILVRPLAVAFSILVGFQTASGATGDEKLFITRPHDSLGFLEPVPVNISGFTGEVDSVLKNDLLFMGVKNVPLEQAQYLITGSNAGRVEGRLTDKTTKFQLLAKAYTG